MPSEDEPLFSTKNWTWLAVAVLLGALFVFLPPIAAEQDTLYRAFTPLVVIKAHIQKRYVEEISDEELVEGAVRGMLRALDPYSSYLSPKEYPVFVEQMAGGYVGIGVQFDARATRLLVTSPLENSPAYTAGVRAGDEIIEISGSAVKFANILKDSERLRGVAMPFTFRRLGADPAIASGPFVTTITDITSVSIYLTLAMWIAS